MAMDPSLLQALVEQAAAAEARLSQIENKIKAGSSSSSATVSDLQELRSLLLEAKAENEQLSAQREEAVKAAKAAEAEVSKLNYRIEHLVKSLRAADQQLTASSRQH